MLAGFRNGGGVGEALAAVLTSKLTSRQVRAAKREAVPYCEETLVIMTMTQHWEVHVRLLNLLQPVQGHAYTWMYARRITERLP
jgi:hypothetical protein